MQPSDSAPSSIESPTVPMSHARLWAWAMGAGLVAGLVAWLGGEGCIELIKPPRHAVNSKGLTLNVASRWEEAVAVAKNSGLAFLILGAALGTTLGAAGGLARRCRRATVTAAPTGLVMGMVVSGCLSAVILPAYTAYQLRHPDEASRDLVLPLLVHVGIWSGVGAVGGLALGLGLGLGLRERGFLIRAVEGGFIGAAIGAAAYELIGAFAFPAARTAQFVSATWETRLLARLAVTVLASAGAAIGVSSPRNRPAASPPPA